MRRYSKDGGVIHGLDYRERRIGFIGVRGISGRMTKAAMVLEPMIAWGSKSSYTQRRQGSTLLDNTGHDEDIRATASRSSMVCRKASRKFCSYLKRRMSTT